MTCAGVYAVAVGMLLMAGSVVAAGRTVWDGVYTEAQAERGEKVLLEACTLCHGETMRGGGGVPSAVGPEFLFNWNEKTVSELFVYLKTTMPPTAPGSLSDQKYADAMAAVLKRNGFPASGVEEISSEPGALAEVKIVPAPP